MLFVIIPFAIAILSPILYAVSNARQRRQAEREAAARAAAEAEAKAAAKRAAEVRRCEEERRRREAEARQAAAKAAAAEAKRREREAKQAERAAAAEKKRHEREAIQAANHSVRLARAAELAEQAERRLAAEREIARLRHESAESKRPDIIPALAKPAAKPLSPIGNGAFAGQVVSFTGRLPGMTRNEAIEAVRRNGGKAFATMPAATTLLVVGDRPGMQKLDKADAWIASVRKITAAQFADMLSRPAAPNGPASFVMAPVTR